MEDIIEFAIYEIRKQIFLDLKTKVDILQTTIAKLSNQIRSTKFDETPKKQRIDIETIISIKDEKKFQLKETLESYNYAQKLYLESKRNIEIKFNEYENSNVHCKNKNIFYIYYYGQFIRPKRSLESIAYILDISYDYTRKLNRYLFIKLSNEIKILQQKI